MDSMDSDMQWENEKRRLTNPLQATLATRNEKFISSPFSTISMDSGINDTCATSLPSPSYSSDAFSPNYGHFEIYPTPTSNLYEGYDHQALPLFLEVLEQPNDNFRFRYPTEMHGPHGTIKGHSSGINGKASKTFPTVVLRNYSGTSEVAEVVIKCSLYQKEDGKIDEKRLLHPHKLAMRPADIESHDPHYVKVSKENNYTANFIGLGIIQTKKEQMAEVLANKIKKEREYEKNTFLDKNEIESIRVETKIMTKKKIEINQVALGFTAFMKLKDRDEWMKITETVFSNIINNEKSVNGKLSIARMSVCKGEAQGGTEIFMFVTKVDKNTIQVRFYETENNTENGSIVWQSNGIFSPSDVHHQYGIILRTPPYQNQQIEEDVTVFVQLYRKNSPSNGKMETSLAVPFTYKPNRIKRKLAHRTSSIPTVVTSYESQDTATFPAASSSSLSGNIKNDELDTITREQQEDSDIVNLLLTITAEGTYEEELPFLDISSIVRDLRGGYEIDSIIPKTQNTLIINEKIFKILVNSISGDSFAFANLIEKGKIEDIEIFTLLIVKYKLKIFLESKNDVEQSILHISILNGYSNMFKVFLKLGVDANQSDAFGETPLHLAVLSDSNEFLNALLLIKNLNIDKTNDKGETPLSLSVLHKKISVTKSLIHAGASPSIINPTNGFNCLHTAVSSIKPTLELIRFLTEHDPSMLHVKTNSSKSVLQMAIENGLTQEIIDHLATFQKSDNGLEIDEICMQKLCEIFDSKGEWKMWATLMNIEEEINTWEKLESPSRGLFTYLKDSKKSLDDLIGLFDYLNDKERDSAINYIDEMIARRFEL